MAEGDFDFTLLGDLVVNPTTDKSADPVQLLTNKGIVLYFGAKWSERKFELKWLLGYGIWLFDDLLIN